MTTLSELAEELASAARRLSNLQQEAARVEQAVRARVDVIANRDRAKVRFGFLDESVRDGRLPSAIIPVPQVRDAAVAAKLALECSSDEIVAKTAEANKKAADLSDVLRSVAGLGWRSLVVKLNLIERRALVEALRHVPQYRAEAAMLIALLNTLESQMRSEFVTRADYRLFKETLEEFEEAFNQLKISESPDVEVFLRQFAMGLATMVHLTDDARDWIREQGIESSFHIRPAR